MTDAEDYYDPNQGFFFTNPDSGQRQFFVPFAGTVMAKLAKTMTGANYSGAPIAFSANPMSFNFAFGAGTLLPGIGPGVTLPLSAIATFNNNFILTPGTFEVCLFLSSELGTTLKITNISINNINILTSSESVKILPSQNPSKYVFNGTFSGPVNVTSNTELSITLSNIGENSSNMYYQNFQVHKSISD
jgi:hypothetical protein